MSADPREFDYDAPALHPRLAESATIAALAESWRACTQLRIQPILAPGLAAELCAFVPNLPISPQLDGDGRELSWRCQIVMPSAIELQYPACLYRLRHLLEHELPRLASAITDRPLTNCVPNHIDIHIFRKGSYIDGLAGQPDIRFLLGLTGTRWPLAWGWTPVLAGGNCRSGRRRDRHIHETGSQIWPLAYDALDLYGLGRPRVPLITRHVQGVAVMGQLVE